VAEISAKDVKALRDQTGAGMMDCKSALVDASGDVDKAVELLRERGLSKAGKRAGRETSEGAIGIALDGENASIIELGCETDFVAKTDDFQSLTNDIAGVVARDASVQGPAEALAAVLQDGTIEDRIKAHVAKLGENIELKRVARIAVDGITGGYVHGGGKLGVIVALACESAAPELDELAKDLAMHVAASDPAPVAVDRTGVSAEFVEKERELLRREAEHSGKPANVIDRIVEGRIGKFYADHCLLEQPFVKDPDRSVQDRVKEAAQSVGQQLSVTGFTRFLLGESGESGESGETSET